MQGVPTAPELDDAPAAEHERNADADESIREELLIEEISIDGMCGVY